MIKKPEWLSKDASIADDGDFKQLTDEAYRQRYADTNPEFHLLHFLGLTVPEQAAAPVEEATISTLDL